MLFSVACSIIRKQTYSEKLKILSTHSITYYPVIVSHSQMVLRPTYPYHYISFQFAKLLATELILYHTAFLESFRDLKFVILVFVTV